MLDQPTTDDVPMFDHERSEAFSAARRFHALTIRITTEPTSPLAVRSLKASARSLLLAVAATGAAPSRGERRRHAARAAVWVAKCASTVIAFYDEGVLSVELARAARAMCFEVLGALEGLVTSRPATDADAPAQDNGSPGSVSPETLSANAIGADVASVVNENGTRRPTSPAPANECGAAIPRAISARGGRGPAPRG